MRKRIEKIKAPRALTLGAYPCLMRGLGLSLVPAQQPQEVLNVWR